MSTHPPIPENAVAVGWHEFTYPRTLIDEPNDAFRRGVAATAGVLWREWTRGMAVVPLPKPDRGGFIWHVEDDEEIHALRGNHSPRIAVQTGEQWTYFPVDLARARAVAMLAACDRAEQLAAERHKAST